MAPAQESRSLGVHLRALRSSAGASLADMAVATRISERYLRAIESDVPDNLPAPVFVKGFIRAYCSFLGAPSGEALALYQETLGLDAAPEPRTLPGRPPASWISHPIAVSGMLVILFGGGLLILNAADVLYGVTMEEPGLSRLVSVKLTDT